MLRKGVNNGRSKLSSVMKKDKSKNSTYILVNQVSFHRFCCLLCLFVFVFFFVFLMMMRIGKATTTRRFVYYITHNSKSTSTR